MHPFLTTTRDPRKLSRTGIIRAVRFSDVRALAERLPNNSRGLGSVRWKLCADGFQFIYRTIEDHSARSRPSLEPDIRFAEHCSAFEAIESRQWSTRTRDKPHRSACAPSSGEERGRHSSTGVESRF